MENKTIKTTMNKVMITGKLVKNGLEEKQTKKNVEAIMGSLIVRTSDGSEHEISLFTNKYKKDDKGNFTNEESKLYTAYRTIIDEYRGMDELSEGESPMVISITNGEFTDNVFKSNEGKLIESNKIRTTFVNRVDETIVFNPLTENELLQIVDLLLEKTKEALSSKEISLELSEDAKKYIASKGTDLKYGARPLRRAIQRYLEDELSDMILKGELKNGQKVLVDYNNEKLNFKVEL